MDPVIRTLAGSIIVFMQNPMSRFTMALTPAVAHTLRSNYPTIRCLPKTTITILVKYFGPLGIWIAFVAWISSSGGKKSTSPVEDVRRPHLLGTWRLLCTWTHKVCESMAFSALFRIFGP